MLLGALLTSFNSFPPNLLALAVSVMQHRQVMHDEDAFHPLKPDNKGIK